MLLSISYTMIPISIIFIMHTAGKSVPIISIFTYPDLSHFSKLITTFN